MRKTTLTTVTVILAALVLLLVACAGGTVEGLQIVHPADVLFADGQLWIEIGDRLSLSPVVSGTRNFSRDVIWSVNNSAVLEQRDTGIFFGMSAGTAIVTVRSAAEQSITQSVTVRVVRQIFSGPRDTAGLETFFESLAELNAFSSVSTVSETGVSLTVNMRGQGGVVHASVAGTVAFEDINLQAFTVMRNGESYTYIQTSEGWFSFLSEDFVDVTVPGLDFIGGGVPGVPGIDFDFDITDILDFSLSPADLAALGASNFIFDETHGHFRLSQEALPDGIVSLVLSFRHDGSIVVIMSAVVPELGILTVNTVINIEEPAAPPALPNPGLVTRLVPTTLDVDINLLFEGFTAHGWNIVERTERPGYVYIEARLDDGLGNVFFLEKHDNFPAARRQQVHWAQAFPHFTVYRHGGVIWLGTPRALELFNYMVENGEFPEPPFTFKDIYEFRDFWEDYVVGATLFQVTNSVGVTVMFDITRDGNSEHRAPSLLNGPDFEDFLPGALVANIYIEYVGGAMRENAVVYNPLPFGPPILEQTGWRPSSLPFSELATGTAYDLLPEIDVNDFIHIGGIFWNEGFYIGIGESLRIAFVSETLFTVTRVSLSVVQEVWLVNLAPQLPAFPA